MDEFKGLEWEIMSIYQQACEDHINKKSKEYKEKKEFLDSAENGKEYPELRKKYLDNMKDLATKGKNEMASVSAKVGQKVFYNSEDLWGRIDKQEGTIKLDKYGIPCVKLNSGDIIRWHKGFKELK